MNQQRMILGLTSLALVGIAGIWAWHANSAAPTATPTASMATSPFRAVNAPVRRAAPEPTPVVTPAPQAAPAPVPADEGTQAPAAPVNAEPPSVDTPEPSQRKFAHGARAEPEQI
jgi:hypothetical protein